MFKLGKFIVSMNDGNGKTTLSEEGENFLNAGDDISRASLVGDTACVIIFYDATNAVECQYSLKLDEFGFE